MWRDTMILEEVINLDVPLYAHRQKEKFMGKETLKAHSELCLEYFDRIVENKELKKILNSIFECYFEDKDMMDLAFELLHGAVLFHDTGKINPLFQRIKMENTDDKREAYKNVEGANHSILSSAIYYDYHLKIVNEQENTLKKKILGLISLNSYIISRHHSNLNQATDFFDSFAIGGEMFNIIEGLNEVEDKCYKGLKYLNTVNVTKCATHYKKAMQHSTREQEISMYVYTRLIYSLLVAADYYATTEYLGGVRINDFGQLRNIDELVKVFDKDEQTKTIRKYQETQYNEVKDFTLKTDINVLRNELFLDAEKTMLNKKDRNIFFLEAPTGSGKSNTAMNLSFQLLGNSIKKIFYVYPFNTLVEQNLVSLEKIFGVDPNLFSNITVVNGITPISGCKKNTEESSYEFYQRCLLDRQFLNYPFILTTHVSLFQTMFGNRREDVFGFLQLANSVIVLDEIQSYKNSIWAEIMIFLENFAKLLNIKVIIMSATLPDLTYLSGGNGSVVNLISDRRKYFNNPTFKERVVVKYELLEEKIDLDILLKHIMNQDSSKKIMIEFINKNTAKEFYKVLLQQEDLKTKIFLLTGEDNQIERKKVLSEINAQTEEGVILVATQVVEAGIDIDMDIGYKDISKLDSEEQFMGRINRSCKRVGVVYFFDYNDMNQIYKIDPRTNTEFTLKSDDMRRILREKTFKKYYSLILECIKKNFNETMSESSLTTFFESSVKRLDCEDIAKRMKLIDDDTWTMPIFFARDIELLEGKTINGTNCWEKYKELLKNETMDYAEKQVLLSQVKSEMYNFIYQVNKGVDLIFDDQIGEIGYIQDGEQYFVNGKLDIELLSKRGGLFIEL